MLMAGQVPVDRGGATAQAGQRIRIRMLVEARARVQSLYGLTINSRAYGPLKQDAGSISVGGINAADR
jgi:hypothetical protein